MKKTFKELSAELDQEIFETKFVDTFRSNTIEELIELLNDRNKEFLSGVIYAKYLNAINAEVKPDNFCLECAFDIMKLLKLIAGPDYIEFAHEYITAKGEGE
ncbi:hypothetical protein [Desulfogranum japonicum]|uniref:hypothetical protein n=1 Tax=Desulfogranum japonicum TaxID=231447 RepID=UPI00041E2477|nr:hypothetical protein [Desulfogranum japonicum]